MGYVVSQASDLWSITASSSGDGSAATVNTGRAFYAGNSSSTTLTSLDPGSKIGVFNGTSVKIPAGVGTQGGPTGILSNAPGYPTTNFASMTAGSYVMKTVTTTLAGVSNTFLRSGAGYMSGRRSIHKLETVRTWQIAKALVAGNWNITTGAFSSAINVTEDAYTPSANNAWSAFDQQAGLGATSGTLDDAARPTAAIPGELVFHGGSGQPSLANYSARTTW